MATAVHSETKVFLAGHARQFTAADARLKLKRLYPAL
jgi:hypothetical protein